MILYFFCIVFILGAAVGSFINCLVWRLYHNQSLLSRSCCPNCSQKIAWYDNVPILSYLLLKARCRHCRQPISSQYYWLEVITGCLFVFALWYRLDFQAMNLEAILWAVEFDWHWLGVLLRDWLLLSALTAIFLADYKWFVVFDEICLSAAVALLTLNLLLGQPCWSLLIGSGFGLGVFWLQSAISRGAWVGDGDLRIGFLMGAALGWPLVAVGLLSGYFLGALWGLWLAALGKKKFNFKRLWKKGEPDQAEIIEAGLPFGTVLAIGSFIALYWGQAIIDWYLGRIL